MSAPTTPRTRFGDICGIAAFVVTVIGLFIPAQPGRPTESGTWFLIGIICLMAVLGIEGLWHGSTVGRFTGMVAVVFAGFMVYAVGFH